MSSHKSPKGSLGHLPRVYKSQNFTRKTTGLRLLMKQRDGAWKSVGTLFVRCKPGDSSEPFLNGRGMSRSGVLSMPIETQT